MPDATAVVRGIVLVVCATIPLAVAKTSQGCTNASPVYLMMLNSTEGMGGWLRLLTEWVAVAKSHHLKLVEPCVKHGSIVPCAASNDTLPLSGYLDIDHLRKTIPVVPFADFVGRFRALPAAQRSMELRYSSKRRPSNVTSLAPAILPLAACVALKPLPFSYNSYSILKDLAQVVSSVRATVLVLTDPFRHKKHKRTPLLPRLRLQALHFAPQLVQQAEAFARLHLGTRYAALHWRAGILAPSQFPVCVRTVEARVRRLLARNCSTVLLVTDLPSPATGYHPLWDLRDFNTSHKYVAPRVQAAQQLQRLAQVVRYVDVVGTGQDLGVVAVVELMLALHAAELELCGIPECSKCTRPHSKYTEELRQRREQLGLPFSKSWL